MKATVDAHELAEVLGWVDRAVGYVGHLPALSGVLLSAYDGWLQLSATDLDSSAFARLPADIDEPGKVLAPRRLLAIAKRLPAAPASLSASDRLQLTCRRIDADLPLLELADYPPPPPGIENESTPLAAETVERLAKHVAPVAGRSGKVSEAALTGITIQPGEQGAVFTASDRYRLQRLEVEAGGLGASVLPTGLFAYAPDGPVGLAVGETHAAVAGNGRVLQASRIAGQVPNFDALLPTELAWTATVERDALLDALALCGALDGHAAHLVVEAEHVAVSAAGEDGGVQDAIDAVATEPFTLTVNAGYLAGLVRCHRGDELTFGQGRQHSPVLITSDDPQLTSLVMPIKEPS